MQIKFEGMRYGTFTFDDEWFVSVKEQAFVAE